MNKNNQTNLSDILENQVDEIYYLSDDKLKQAAKHTPNFNPNTHQVRQTDGNRNRTLQKAE